MASWQNFYMMVGSAAGALIGLQFVVLALMATLPRTPELAQAGRTFTTPTIVHFTAVLMLSGAMTIPWSRFLPVALLWALEGAAGLAYAIAIARRMNGQSSYTPELEDWIFHAALPIAAFALEIAAALAALMAMLTNDAAMGRWAIPASLYGVAATAMMLLATGIHNAWDTVSYHVFVIRVEHGEK